MGEVNVMMGIEVKSDDNDPSHKAFSQDLLKIEISEPTQEHFTVIDVPGIFRLTQEGLTTEDDVVLVRNMVKSYMEDSRTIILALLPSNVDISNQEILELAKAADPSGSRTTGILTKPDLVSEDVNREAIKNVVLDKRNEVALGYYLVKNRGADDQTSTSSERLVQEEESFAQPGVEVLGTK